MFSPILSIKLCLSPPTRSRLATVGAFKDVRHNEETTRRIGCVGRCEHPIAEIDM